MGLWRDSSVDDDDLVASNEENNENPVKRQKTESDQDLNDSSSVSSAEYEIEEISAQKKSPKSDGRLAIGASEDHEEPMNKSDSEEKKPKKNSTKKSQFACIRFYQELNTKCYAVVVDCYAKMFLCDFINCIITIFTYQYFWVIIFCFNK